MNKQIKLLSALLAVSSLLLLAGCAKYKAKPLPTLTTHQKNNQVTLLYKAFDKKECKNYLGRKKVLRKGYQPVQVAISNTTNRTYTCSASDLSLPTIPAEMVARKMYFSTGSRAVGIGLTVAVGSILAVTAIMGGCGVLAESWFWRYVFPPMLLFSGVPFTAGATSAGVKYSQANKDLRADFTSKSLAKEIIIKPGQTVSGIIFVPKNDFKNNFTLTIYDTRTDKALVLSSNAENLDIKK